MSELQEPDLPAGATFGAYQIVRPLGVGMSGTVYEALELATSRRVALKVLHASIARKRNMVHRFMREATAAAKLQHPHVVATYDVGQWEGRYFLAMELLHGENLAQRLKREGRLLPKVAVDLLLPVLAYALLGSSRQLVIGPEATSAALVATAVAPLADGDPARYLTLASLLALLVGVGFLLARLVRLGWVADYLSRAALVGFVHGIVVILVCGQLGKLTGVPISADMPIGQVTDLLRGLDELSVTTLVTGLVALAFLFGIKAIAPKAMVRSLMTSG